MVQKRFLKRLMALYMCLTVLLSGCGKQEEASPVPEAEAPEEEVQEDLEEKPVEEPYKRPTDFEKLQKRNEDIYAWIEIPKTEISFPVVQHPEDDAYYLKHNIDHEDDRDGAIFTEHEFNSKDFNDPVTIIYGHNMRRKNFGTLQELYSDINNLETLSEIVIYLPDRELYYDVFAAVPFDDRHILYSHDFTDERTFHLFLDELCHVRALGANYNLANIPREEDDKILILSTCLMGDLNQRYLVCGKKRT